MPLYNHALLLAHDEFDGEYLLKNIAIAFHQQGTTVMLGHFTSDYRPLDIASDSRVKNRQSQEIINSQAMLSRLVKMVDFPIKIRQIITIHRFQDIEKLVQQEQIDLVVMCHKNRLLGTLTSHSIEFINQLSVDVLIKHINIP